MSLSPTVLSPGSPSDLLSYILTYHTYPTAILICSPREEFLASLAQDIQGQALQDELAADQESGADKPVARSHPLLATPLFKVAASRHLRIVFIPTVSHLRAYLSVFDPTQSNISPPPNHKPFHRRPPLLLIYGFLDLHRDTSEWSAQGISNTAATFVEASKRVSFKAVIVEPKSKGSEDMGPFDSLAEAVPVLSGSPRKEGGGWAGRTTTVKRVLGRWFEVETGQ
jgi:hypothetical protein